MKSLGEISQQIAELGEYRESSGENILLIGTNAGQTSSTARVFRPLAGTWTGARTFSGIPTHIAESEGNFLVVAGNQVLVYSATASDWLPAGSSPFIAAGTVRKVSTSKGTLGFATDGTAYGFKPSTNTFVSQSVGGTTYALEGSD